MKCYNDIQEYREQREAFKSFRVEKLNHHLTPANEQQVENPCSVLPSSTALQSQCSHTCQALREEALNSELYSYFNYSNTASVQGPMVIMQRLWSTQRALVISSIAEGDTCHRMSWQSCRQVVLHCCFSLWPQAPAWFHTMLSLILILFRYSIFYPPQIFAFVFYF